jgi:hypothetical protein
VDVYLPCLPDAATDGAHTLRMVEREDIGVADEWLAYPRKLQPQRGVDIRGGPYGRANVAA